MASSEPAFSCCILLIHGIPGSGKTLLADYLCSHCPWSTLPVHFDSFYPTDTRNVSLSDQQTSGSEMAVVEFQMKGARLAVVQCLEHLIELSAVGSEVESPPHIWSSFTSYLQKYPHLLTCHRQTRLVSPSVLVVDDNLPLRSMRYVFYQLAKKYCIGFAEICVSCDLTVAWERNRQRQIPIPDSTIVNMERSQELPQPSSHSWERRSRVLFNNGSSKEDFLTEALTVAKELISEALANPEQQTSPQDHQMKEACRVESLESYVHQADIILRKCVSSSISEYRGAEKGNFAKRSNLLRRYLLDEVRTGGIVEDCQTAGLPATSTEYESRIRGLFNSRLHSKTFISDS